LNLLPATSHQWPSTHPISVAGSVYTKGKHYTQELSGQVFVVTGASSGLGLYCAQSLAKRGATVVAAVRNVDKAKAALASTEGRVEYARLELSDMASVQACADDLKRRFSRLDVLLANAGIMAPPFGLTPDGFELQMGTNHLGHFSLAAALFPLVQAAPTGRLVTVSSIAHRQGSLTSLEAPPRPESYRAHQAYRDSKLANLVFALELSRRLRQAGSHVRSLAAHPGVTETPLFSDKPLVRMLAGFMAMKPADGALPLLEASIRPDAECGSYWGPTGFREIWGSSGLAKPTARAQDPALGRHLWAYSERAIGREFAV
jgi:NAD(P)-dependent dehydrogenase (short-subunit alcohol dehydrogenase family)